MPEEEIRLVLGNSNKRFSGVTSTMLQVLKLQSRMTACAVLGAHHVPESYCTLGYREFIRVARRELPDGSYRVFHARRNDEMIQALIARRVLGAKIRIAFTSTAQREHSAFSRWLMQQMDAVITTCSAAANYLHHRPPDIVIPHGIDSDRFQPAAARAEAWRQTGLPGAFGIGAFGRVRHSKGIDLLVDAAIPLLQQHHDATLVIVGQRLRKDAPYQRALQDRIAAAGLQQRVQFLGEQPFDRLPLLFSAMTVVAALSREEGFGLTPLEAMASGTAVLTSEAGAWPDVVRDGVDGYRVPVDDVEATRARLAQLLSDRERCEQMGASGRKRVVQHFSVESEARQLTEFLLSLAKPH